MSGVQFRKGTFIIVPNKQHLKKLTMKAQVTWLALCSYADDDGYCWPSVNTMSNLTGIGERTLKRGLEELIEKKFIKKEQRKKDDGSFTSNYYTLYEFVPPKKKGVG